MSEELWIDDLLDLGIGALAIQYLYKLHQGKKFNKPTQCPHCGKEIKKWAMECPKCRRKI